MPCTICELKKNPILFQGNNENTDEFINSKYGVKGKPDMIIELKPNHLVLLFRSRLYGIFDSDIIQAKIAALAARETYPDIKTIYVYNASSRYRQLELPDNDTLARELKLTLD